MSSNISNFKVVETSRFELEELKKKLDTSVLNHNIDLNNSLYLFSPFKIYFSHRVLEKINLFHKSFYEIYKTKFELLKNNTYALRHKLKVPMSLKFTTTPLLCLDFHIDSANETVKLIEANTNASGYLIGKIVYNLHGLDFTGPETTLNRMFLESGLLEKSKLYIVDENPEKQKMYLEFLLYQNHFNNLGYKSEIKDAKEFENLKFKDLKNLDASIYNRTTDFYFDHLPQMKNIFLENLAPLKPNPIDFDLWAHKDNLSEISERKSYNPSLEILFNSTDLQQGLLKSDLIQKLFLNIDEAWSQRKNYFFKPSESFGGKASYKGQTVSRKYFNLIWDNNFLSQEYFPPGVFKDKNQTEWKFDLRVFVYNSEIIYCMARVYQGQITNFSTLGGGFAPVLFEH